MPSRQIIRTVGYVLFGIFCLFTSLYLTFPADALAQRIAREVQRQSRGAWLITYGSASTYHGSGIALDQVVLKRTGSGADPLSIPLDSLRARLRLLPLLLARISVDAAVSAGEGILEARVTPRGGQAFDVRVDAEDFDFAAPPLLARLVGLPVGGKLTGSMDGNWDSDLHKVGGTLAFNIEAANVGPGSVAGFGLPRVELGNVELGAELKDTKLRVTQFKQKGGNISLQAKGNAQLREPLAQASNMDFCMQVRADPAFLSSNPKIKTALQLAEVQFKKDAEGYLNLPLSGTISQPRVGNSLCR